MKRSKKFIYLHWRAIGLLSAPLWAFAPIWVAAGPTGGQIVGGSGSITRPNNNLTEIHQGSNRLAIDWQSFDVNANDVVKFIQPSSRSIALNRILDSKQSLILGRVEANGRLFLINPRGIIFGKDATINVAGLVASSLDINPHDFLKGTFAFTDKGGEGVIVNQGTIEAAVGGAVVLLGKVVINEGDIHAPQGSARLVSAAGAVISFDDNNQLGIQITAEQAQKIADQTDAVRNSGKISAEGGYIALTGATTADLFTNAVNNAGVLVANSMHSHNGVIELTGGEGNIALSGQVDVSGANKNNGGKISISGNAIHDTGKLIADGANGGDIQLHAKDLILTENNASISAKGNSGKGGKIELLGDRVGVMDQSRIDASGASGGGVVHVGGEFHGAGPRNAQRTVVDNGVSIYADATKKGNGGEVVLWSDEITYFGGNIFARGGPNGGNGGNVETSGKQSLNFTGFVDTSAPHGKMGSLLLDPAIINIINGSGGADDAQVTGDNIINSGDGGGATYTISEAALEGLSGSVTLAATQQINIANLTDNQLLFNAGGGTVTFNVTGSTGTSSFTMADLNDEIRVNNGSLAIAVANTGTASSGAVNITAGKLTTTGGSISVQGSSTTNASTGAANSSGVTIAVGAISAGTTVNVSGTTQAFSGPSTATAGAVAITTGNINASGAVSLTGSTNGDNSSGSSATAGNASVTAGNITTSGAVTVSTSSTTTPAANGGTNPGTGAATVGNIIAGGAVNLSATSSASNGLGGRSGDVTTVTAADISVTNNAAVHITASSSNNASVETVNIGGNYIQNGGNYTIDTYTLNLTSNTAIDTTGTITLNYTVLNTNGWTLTQGAINNIYVGDISGSAGAGDLGFSQANITAFAGSGLVLSALNNIYLGNATIDSPSATSVQLIADKDLSGVGDISIASGKTFNLNGRDLIASGANASINGTILNSGAGAQQITTTGAITMGAGATLASASGNISLNAGTSISMASNASIASASGQLALTAANNIALGSLSTANTTTSAVNITSTAGAISNAGATTNIFANAAGSRVALNAISGINAALSIADLALTNSTSGTVTLTNNRALQIDSFTNTPATTASITTTGAGSNMTIAGNVSSGSNLSLISSGAFTVNDGFTVNSNAGTLSINSTGDAAITGLTSTNNTASAVSVISGGAITDGGSSNTDITATGASAVVTLQAANGIGAADALDTSIANLTLSNSTSGAVNLSNNRSLQINSLTNTPATAASITTTGATSDLTVAGATSSGGALSLTSGRNMTIAGNTSSSGNMALTSSGTFSVTDGFTVNSNAGTLAINSTGNAAITGLTTTNNTASAISVISGGAISDNGNTNPDITATGASAVVTLQAVNGIGAANALDTSIANLSLSNSASGAVNLTNNRSLQINSLTNTPATAASITTTGATSDLTVAGATSSGGALSLTSGRNMTIAGNTSSSGNMALTSSGTFSVTDGFTVNSNAGTLAINSTGNAAITGLTSTNNTASAISVISGGAISDNGDTALDITETQASGVVTLQAANGIGAANALDTSIANLSLSNSASGAVNLSNNRSLQINSLTNTPATAASITTTGATSDLTVAGATSSGGALTLQSGRNMTIAGNTSSSGNMALTSSGTFSVTDGFTVNSNAGTLAINSTGNAAITGLTTTNNTASAISVISGGAISDNGDTNRDITATQTNAVVTLQAVNGIGAANALDTSIANLALSNSTSGAVNLSNNRSLQINSLANTPATAASITTTGATSDLTVAGATSSGGALSLTSGRNMTIAGNTSSSGNMALTSSGTFSVTDGFTVNSNAGTLAINSTGNAAITGLTTTNNSASAISVISGGAISDSGDTNADITATQASATATLQAASGIGSSNAIDFSATNIAATNGASGDIRLHALGSYTFGAINNSTSAGGAVALSSDGNLTANNITTANGAIILSAVDNVSLASSAALQSSGGAVSITADTNSNGVGAITMGSGTINSGSGTIALSAAQDINLNQLTTTNATTSAVSITSTAGKILGNFDGTPDITAASAGSRVTLSAATGINASSNPLELSVLDLIATNSTSGNIDLTNNRALQISGVTNIPATTTTIATTGVGSNMTVAGNIASGSNLTLTSSGTFTVNNGNTINSNAGTLTINSTGNAAITGLQSSNNTASAISVTSSAGAITDAGADNLADITTTGASSIVTLTAANGIGSANAIDLNLAGQVTASNTTGGNIGLNALTSFTFSNISNSFATGAVTLSSSGGSLTVNNITTNNGAITLSAADNVTLNTGAALQSSGGNVSITADTNANNVGAITMNTGTIDSGAGTITLSAAQDINLNRLTTTNATTSAVSITSTLGKILGNFDGASDITATGAGSRVTLHAATGIDAGGANPLELSVNDLIATNSISGGINLTNDRALQISGVTNTPVGATTITTTGVGSDMTVAGNIASGSNLTLTSSGTFTVNDGNTVNSNAGTLAINATGDAIVTGLQSSNNTANAIRVISGGAITDNGNAVLDITATQVNAVVTLQAASGIGAANALDLAIANLSLSNSTSGAVNLTNNRAVQINSFANTLGTTASITTTGAGSNMTVAGNVASGSDIALTSSGTFSVTDGFTINPTAGTLSINATGNAAITGLTTTNNTVNAISVISGGAITDNGNSNADITATGANAVVTLQAANGIGAANALDLSISRLALSNSTSGAVALTNNRALQINSFTNTPATTASVTTTGIGSDMTIAGNIASGSNLTLVSSGALTVSDGNTVNSNAGTLSITSVGDAAITGLTTTNNTVNAISVISGGAISDNGDTALDITATQPNAVVTLQAANGIGAANPLDLAIANLALSNSAGGAVNLTNNRTLQINSLNNTPVTTTTITTTGVGSNMTVAGNISSGSDLALNSAGTFTVNDGSTVNSNAGTLAINSTGNAAITGLQSSNTTASAISVISGGAITDSGDTNADLNATQAGAIVTLQAVSGIGNGNAIDINGQIAASNGSSGDIGLHALGSYTFGAIDNSASTNGAVALSSDGNLTVNNVTTTNGAITLSAADNVSLAPSAALQSNGGAVSIAADTNTNGVGAIAMGSGTINSGSGTIALSAVQDINLNQLTTTNATTSAVTITSTAGKIFGNSDGTSDITATSAGSRVNLHAAAGIDAGGSNPLELSVLDVIATNSISGGINLINDRALQISGVTNTPVGATTIVTTGVGSDMTIAGNIASGSNLTLTSSGAFTVNDGNTVNSNGGTLSINTSGDAAITGLQSSNTTANAIRVISGGAITDSGDTNADITAIQPGAVVTLQAASGIGTAANAMDISGQIAATNGSSGDIGLHALGSYTFGAIDNSASTNGAVALSSDGNLTVNNVTTTNGTIALSAADNVSLAPSAALQSNGGAVSIAADTNTNGVGAIAMGSGTINSGAGTITLNAAQDINLNRLTTTNATTNAVSVTSTAGKILGNFDGTADITATSAGSRVNLHAVTGIDAGGINPLELSINDLIATNSISGGINLTNDRALQISGVTNTPVSATTITTTGVGSDMTVAGNVASGSNLTLTSSGAFTVNDGNRVNSNGGTLSISAVGDAAITGLQSSNNTANAVHVTSTGGAIVDNGDTNFDIDAAQPNAIVTLQAANGIGNSNALEINGVIAATNGGSGDIELHTLGSYTFGPIDNSASPNGAVVLISDGSLTVNNVTTTNGAITLSAADNVSLAPNSVLQSNGGAVSINADLDNNGIGSIAMGSGTINSGVGTIALSAAQDINLNRLITTNATTNAVSVTSTVGKILGNSDGVADITATNGGSRVTLSAARGIDAGSNPLELSVLDLIATNSTSGGINLSNDRALQISGVTNTPATTTTIVTTGIGSNMTVAGDIASGSNLTLTSSGAFAVNDGNTVNANAGTLAINSTGNAAVTGLQSSNNSANAITVVSGGAIVDSGDTHADLTATQPNAVVTLQAANGIGTAVNALDIDVANITANNGTSGDIGLHALGSYSFGAVNNSASANGAVALSSDGNLTATNVTTANGAIMLGALGQVALGNGASLTSNGGTIALNAGTDIAMTNNASITSTNGQIALTAVNDIALGALSTGNTTANAITVTSTAGAISNAGAATNISASAAGSRVALNAANGINVDLSVADLVATNSTSGAIALTNNRSLQIDSLTNNANSSTTISVTGAASDLIFAGTLQNGGGDATLTATRNIDLQNVANVAALSTDSAIVNYAQSISAGSISSTGTANVAGNLTGTTGNIDLQTVAIGAGAHAFSTTGSGDINLGAVTGNSDLQLSSGKNITVTGAGLGAGNFAANSTASGVFTANGTISAAAVTVNQFSTANLQGVVAGNTLDVTAATINLGDNLLSNGAMTLTGTTQLQKDISLSTTGSAGAVLFASVNRNRRALAPITGNGGGMLQLAGSVDGNGHALMLAAGNDVVCIACTPGAIASNLAALDIQSSIKTVLGTTSVNGDVTIRANQEIYLNGDTTITGNLSLLADANNDGIGVAGLLTGKTLSVGGTLTVQPIALSSISTPAQCAAPTGFPQMPSEPLPEPGGPSGPPTPLTNADVQIAVQEGEKYGLAASDAMLRNSPQIAYLSNSCQSDPDHKNRELCDVDASMMDFLGTFLIDNQIPKNGSGQ